MLNNYFLLLLIFFAFIYYVNANENIYLEVKPKSGDGIENLLLRYELSISSETINTFIDLNKENLSQSNGLFLNKFYKIPILVYKYNGTSIRSTINNNDWDYAVSIQKYNERMHAKRIKSGDYRNDLELWVPIGDFKHITSNEPAKPILQTYDFPLFGNKHKQVKERDHKLKGHIYYLVSGHGGPDPGAIGKHGNYELHEDEYAYDVTLRLAKRLLEHGATVHVIVQDPNDGIRDDRYLKNSDDEYYIDGSAISADQVERLTRRAEIINELYEKESSIAKSQQALMIHVDSRSYGQRIDIFFYYHENSSSGLELATTLQETIKVRYRNAQPNRGYEGTVTHRNLFMLRNTKPTSVFIELGNIRNSLDQIRFLEKNNRQAIANWLCEGLLNSALNK